MRILPIIALALATGFASAQVAAPTILISNGEATVTNEDFEAFLLRLPPASRVEARANLEWIGKAVDNVFESRVLAQDARRRGLDKDPRIALRLKQIEEAYLAQVWVEQFRKDFKTPKLEQRARELYLLGQDRLKEPERLDAQFIAISLLGRTPEMAKAIADEVHRDVIAGKDFAELSAKHSEPTIHKRTKGRMDQVSRDDLDKVVADALFALKKPGDISAPVQTRDGIVIVKLDKRYPARVKTFAEVEKDIIAEETNRLQSVAIETEIARLKNPPKLVVETKNIEALHVDIDRSKLDRLHREALERAQREAIERAAQSK